MHSLAECFGHGQTLPCRCFGTDLRLLPNQPTKIVLRSTLIDGVKDVTRCAQYGGIYKTSPGFKSMTKDGVISLEFVVDLDVDSIGYAFLLPSFHSKLMN